MPLNPLNAELNPICHLLALLGGATIVVVSRLRVNIVPVISLKFFIIVIYGCYFVNFLTAFLFVGV